MKNHNCENKSTSKPGTSSCNEQFCLFLPPAADDYSSIKDSYS